MLAACDLPTAWRGEPAWRILDTAFDPARLLAAWQLWGDDPRAPACLHYVALTPRAPRPTDILAAAAGHPQRQTSAQELAALAWGLLPGFHRLPLAAGRLQLTLCVGDGTASLREQDFAADSLLLDASAPETPAWDRWQTRLLARCSRPGTRLATRGLTPEQRRHLHEAGFRLDEAGQGSYDPPWPVRHRHRTPRPQAAPPADCLVIGAGLAGASVAAALARRGWQVQMLDAGGAAAGASGLPAGLLVPHVSSDDSPRSRLSRSGVRLMLAQAERLLRPGLDWQASGVLERRLDKPAGLPADWPAAGLDWSGPAGPDHLRAAGIAGLGGDAPALWHAHAGWIRPARLIDAWLAQPGVRFRPAARVAALEPQGRDWAALDEAGQELGRAPLLVLANAGAAPCLLAGLRARHPGLAADLLSPPPLQALRGVLSCGTVPPAAGSELPPFPVNGLGSLIPAVPQADGPAAWYAGATYEAADTPTADTHHHRFNLDKLGRLLPAAGALLAQELATGRVQAWCGVRHASPDRLPLVGALQRCATPRLWISAGMGSRGLSFAQLCAELLAARLGGEPLPVETRLAAKLDVARFS